MDVPTILDQDNLDAHQAFSLKKIGNFDMQSDRYFRNVDINKITMKGNTHLERLQKKKNL